tara:strand:- start:1142 stop:1540 length:399 start_codon:yes stop_codon:yes gene_type:complete
MNSLDNLWHSIVDGDIHKTKEFVDKVDNIDQPNDKGWNAIIMAAYNQNKPALEILVEKGANINSTNPKGTTVFMYAKTKCLENRNFGFLDFVLSLGADINARDKKKNWTVLDYVKDIGDEEMISYLLSKGAI